MPPHTRDAVVASVHATFQGCDPATLLAVLDRYGAEPWEPEKERVQLAIVDLCGGDKDKLLNLVQTAKTDYRDVLAWKQFGPVPAEQGEKLRDEARAPLEKWGKQQ